MLINLSVFTIVIILTAIFISVQPGFKYKNSGNAIREDAESKSDTTMKFNLNLDLDLLITEQLKKLNEVKNENHRDTVTI